MKIKSLKLKTILICVFIVASGIIMRVSCSDTLFLNGEDVIEYNWNIRLPEGGKEIYYITGQPSFHGDGPRLSVYEYDNEEIIKSSFTWEDKKNTNMEVEINNVLKMLDNYNDVSKKYIPNLKKDYKYMNKTKDDNSNLYLIYINGENRIYVIEYFL